MVAMAVPYGGQEPLPLKVAPIQPSVTAAFHLQSWRDSDCQMGEFRCNLDESEMGIYGPGWKLETVFKISAGPRTLTGKIWVGPARFGKLSFFIIYKFSQNRASVRQVSDLILKTVEMEHGWSKDLNGDEPGPMWMWVAHLQTLMCLRWCLDESVNESIFRTWVEVRRYMDSCEMQIYVHLLTWDTIWMEKACEYWSLDWGETLISRPGWEMGPGLIWDTLPEICIG